MISEITGITLSGLIKKMNEVGLKKEQIITIISTQHGYKVIYEK